FKLPIPNADGRLLLSEIEHSPTWYVIRDGKPLVGSLDAIGRRIAGPLRNIGVAPRFWLGAPLLRDRAVIGCVVVQSYDETHQYDEQDEALLIYVAQQIQTALERRLAHAELERRVEERTVALRDANRVLQQEVLERQRGERLQAALFRIAELASATASPEIFYAEVHRVVGDLLDARNFYIALLSCDGTELSFPYSANERGYRYQSRKLAKGLTERVIRSAQPLLVDEQEIARLRACGELAQPGSGASCWLGVPLVCAERTVGVLAVEAYSSEHPYTLHDQELLTFVSYQVASALERIRAAESLRQAYANLETRVEERTRDLRAQITERERAEARLRYETLHDALTGLPNRSLLTQRLEQALTRYRADRHQGFAVLYMDLDRFKVINDSEGHQVGDELLQQAGARIRACLKTEDGVARLGGDEFGVLLEGVDDTTRAGRVAQRIINDLNAPFRIDGKELFSSTSIGVALAAPHYRTPEELLRDADSAMYCAKAGGRHRYVVFDHDLRKQAVLLLEVENDLRRGLTRGEFVPYYQPIVDLGTGRVAGYEALMRWRHPQRGVLLPGAFLDTAEDIGLSEAIDWQIFTQACRDANALAGTDGAFVAMNLSPRHFSDPRFDERLLKLLDEYAVPAKRLYVEVTERSLLEDTPAVKRILRALRQVGISISLDDFGTGYSSLSYLHQYPLQALKIDRSFVANLNGDGEGSSDALVRTILAMAESLSLQVIAEGVETPVQRDLLHKFGCGRAQGFLYAKAQPVETWVGVDPVIGLPAQK
ncbi:MAG: bifunctional diguanylate cyclase/phosphodiesterase, partial [Rhodanobacteraceae bacterium]